MLLASKVVIITGAGGGIGEAIARVCHREGASVVVADIRGQQADNVASSLGGRACPVRADVRRDEDLERLVAATLGSFGRIDGLVNNAGIDFSKPFLETTAADWDRVIGTNLRSCFFLSQLAMRRMLGQEPPGGSVVNISSVHSVAGVPGAAPYDVSKAGMAGLTRALAVEFAARGIRVNCLSPGLINTQIWQDLQASAPDLEACLGYWRSNIPIERVIEPCEIAELTAFLLSDRSSCITGTNMIADGGMTARLLSRQM
jgi:NAD(P)-dependent dehydrogenase (short-subunit alcohol dehydrogenase family)